MVETHYRWDFIGLSTDTKPTPETSEKVVDGSTFYCSDNSKLYVWCKNQWYEKEVSGGGGVYTAGDGIVIDDDEISVDTGTIQEKLTAGTGIDITDNTISATGGSGPTVVQTTGTSTTDVMSQDATTKMIYRDPDSRNKIQIGNTAYCDGTYGIAIGWHSAAGNNNKNIAIGPEAGVSNLYQQSISIGSEAYSGASYSVAIGSHAKAQRQGEVNVGAGTSSTGYNSTNYRVIGGVHDGQDAHDAVTIGQINNLIDAINTATGSNISHIGA